MLLLDKNILRSMSLAQRDKAAMHHISNERANNLRDMMFPMDWNCNPTTETFRYPEPITTGVYCTVVILTDDDTETCFECYSSRNVKHSELVQEARRIQNTLKSAA